MTVHNGIKLSVVDHAGIGTYDREPASYKGFDVVLFVFDVADVEVFKSAKFAACCKNLCNEYGDAKAIYVVAAKVDLRSRGEGSNAAAKSGKEDAASSAEPTKSPSDADEENIVPPLTPGASFVTSDVIQSLCQNMRRAAKNGGARHRVFKHFETSAKTGETGGIMDSLASEFDGADDDGGQQPASCCRVS